MGSWHVICMLHGTNLTLLHHVPFLFNSLCTEVSPSRKVFLESVYMCVFALQSGRVSVYVWAPLKLLPQAHLTWHSRTGTKCVWALTVTSRRYTRSHSAGNVKTGIAEIVWLLPRVSVLTQQFYSSVSLTQEHEECWYHSVNQQLWVKCLKLKSGWIFLPICAQKECWTSLMEKTGLCFNHLCLLVQIKKPEL